MIYLFNSDIPVTKYFSAPEVFTPAKKQLFKISQLNEQYENLLHMQTTIPDLCILFTQIRISTSTQPEQCFKIIHWLVTIKILSFNISTS